MIKIKLKTNQTVDEVARWRKTSFNTELTEEELKRLISQHGADLLGAHYDDGVPTGKENDISASGAPVRSREKSEPQTSFNPKASWNTPVGIYYYPLSWAADKIFDTGVPFAGNKKYIYIYKIRDASKRIDATELVRDGFIERAILWAANNKNLEEILSKSGVDATQSSKIVDIYGGGSVFGDSNLSVEDNIRDSFKFYIVRDYAKSRNTIFEKVKTYIKTNGDPKTAIAELALDLVGLADSFLTPKITYSQYLPSPQASREEWVDVVEQALISMDIEKLILDSQEALKSGKNYILNLEALRDNINKYMSSVPKDDTLKKSQVPAKISSPPPNNTIYNILKNNMDEAKIANKCYYIINNMLDKNVTKVTKYFINEGYEVFEDREGTKTIHSSEPFQGIYLTTRIVELIGVYLNRFRSGRSKPSYLNPKQMDPALLRKKLGGENGVAFVDRAFQYARETDPKGLDIFIQYILNNNAIPKDKNLADKIVKNGDIGNISYYSLARYINAFAWVLKPNELEDRLSKLVNNNVKRTIDAESIANASRFVEYFKDTLQNLDDEYGSNFDISKHPTLSFLKDATNKAEEQEKAVVSEGKKYKLVTESRFKKLNRIGRYSNL